MRLKGGEANINCWLKLLNRILDSQELKSKETYGQTRGLSNLEMKYVGKLAIIGTLLKAKQAKLCLYHARSHLSYIA